MNIKDDFKIILDYTHAWNWRADLYIMKEIYENNEESYSVLTPFAYCYLEELIRSTTSQYGREFLDSDGNPKRRKVGMGLINLAKRENSNNKEYVNLLDEIKHYYRESTSMDTGDNRSSVNHGYMHPRFWTKESYEKLIHDIARLSKYSGF